MPAPAVRQLDVHGGASRGATGDLLDRRRQAVVDQYLRVHVANEIAQFPQGEVHLVLGRGQLSVHTESGTVSSGSLPSRTLSDTSRAELRRAGLVRSGDAPLQARRPGGPGPRHLHEFRPQFVVAGSKDRPGQGGRQLGPTR